MSPVSVVSSDAEYDPFAVYEPAASSTEVASDAAAGGTLTVGTWLL